MKPVQYFNTDYLDKTSDANPKQILLFLEEFRLMQAPVTQSSRSKMISLKIPDNLLRLFRAKCEVEGVKYQTQIKIVMSQWLELK